MAAPSEQEEFVPVEELSDYQLDNAITMLKDERKKRREGKLLSKREEANIQLQAFAEVWNEEQEKGNVSCGVQ